MVYLDPCCGSPYTVDGPVLSRPYLKEHMEVQLNILQLQALDPPAPPLPQRATVAREHQPPLRLLSAAVVTDITHNAVLQQGYNALLALQALQYGNLAVTSRRQYQIRVGTSRSS